jgi:iron complex transport system substrate-binding protein
MGQLNVAWPAGSRACPPAGVLVAVALATAMAACTHPDRTVPSRGGAPQRIVSLVPAVTEMLFAIGAGPRMVAVSSYDTFPPEVKRLERVGALFDPDIERILRLRPDLVIVYGNPSELGARLERAGIRTFPYVLGGLDNVASTMRRLGGVVGTGAQADAAAAAVDARLEAIRRRVAGLRRPRTLLVFGHDPGSLREIDASGGTGFLSDIVALAGGDNVFGSVGRESLRVSTEAVLAAAPEVIIDLHYGRHLSPERLDRERDSWKGLPGVPAVRDGRVGVLVGDEFVVPGPRVVRAAEAIAAVIHPPRRRP